MRRKMWPVYAAAVQQAYGRLLTEKKIGQLDKLLGELLAIRT